MGKEFINKIVKLSKDVEGRVAPPLLLWVLGVPGGFCLLLWFFFWRGK